VLKCGKRDGTWPEFESAVHGMMINNAHCVNGFTQPHRLTILLYVWPFGSRESAKALMITLIMLGQAHL